MASAGTLPPGTLVLLSDCRDEDRDAPLSPYHSWSLVLVLGVTETATTLLLVDTSVSNGQLVSGYRPGDLVTYSNQRWQDWWRRWGIDVFGVAEGPLWLTKQG